ncbi:hypothetical protein L1987_20866 [Smallanthus sonchifolius]|uniref:Uncharacterized protein n=1 Tax=Smallanthus sonchifolius TaxID=185202 RepID=A0ACB9IS94_9ASTR|nr:hypothetical protein L1987_20866 [Smallanthus sonchifolius]
MVPQLDFFTLTFENELTKMTEFWGVRTYHMYAAVARFNRDDLKAIRKLGSTKDETGYGTVSSQSTWNKTYKQAVQSSEKGMKQGPAEVLGEKKMKQLNSIDTAVLGGNIDGLKAPELREVHIGVEDMFVLQDEKCCIMGNVFDIQCIENLRDLWEKEGFNEIELRYMGGKWVLLIFPYVEVMKSLCACEDLKVLFTCLKPIDKIFILDERIVWVELTGLPMFTWLEKAYKTLVEKWGEYLILDNNREGSMAIGRVYIRTTVSASINETVVVRIGATSYTVDIKELSPWSSSLVSNEEDELSSSENDSMELNEEDDQKYPIFEDIEEQNFKELSHDVIEGSLKEGDGRGYELVKDYIAEISSKGERSQMQDSETGTSAHSSSNSLPVPPGFGV